MGYDDGNSFDLKKSMAVVGNNKTVFVKLLKTYAASTLMGELLNALEEGDNGLAKDKAHALKGVSGNMRFDEVFDLVKNIEADMKEGKPVTINDASVINLQAAHARALAAINRYIDNPGLLS